MCNGWAKDIGAHAPQTNHLGPILMRAWMEYVIVLAFVVLAHHEIIYLMALGQYRISPKGGLYRSQSQKR